MPRTTGRHRSLTCGDLDALPDPTRGRGKFENRSRTPRRLLIEQIAFLIIGLLVLYAIWRQGR